ncbi:MAG TPA: 50S ribosomal protein L22, partial [Legionellaceae bacterium]|nr:50S ribosomal protein L22 [Legionellaceae bacterium]
ASLSAQKCRLIANMVRNRSVTTALNVLKFTNKKGAHMMLKVLESAIANAENNNGVDIDELKISSIYVDEAATLKRVLPRAKGRANRISKRSCHITIIVSNEE